MKTNIDCVVPFRFARQYGDTWRCPDCGRLWKIKSNQYDSLLPHGDYTWFTSERPESWSDLIFGAPHGHRARLIQPEPNEDDKHRLIRLIHLLHRYGVSHTVALAIYDRNASAELPYHGAAHGVSVALRAHDLGVAEGLGAEHLLPLLIAGIFHDADYVPGDAEEDNLARAVAFARQVLPETHRDAAAALIPETQYPHRKAKTVAGAVLQDADILQTWDVDRDRWLRGLRTETGKSASRVFPEPEQLNTEAGRRFRARSTRA